MLRLMIVDDEQIIREALSQMIDYEALGYQLIATAKNGMEAYDIICDEYPDVVITDIRMPILNGLDLIDRSIKSDSKITFILLSGYNDFEYAKQAMKYGVRYYLLKPTDKNELIDSLVSVRKERLIEEENRKLQQDHFLKSLHFPLEQSFIMEALEHQDCFSPVFRKYQGFLSFPKECQYACICSFVEESYLKSFACDVKRILETAKIPLFFSILYVKNTAVMIFPASTLAIQEEMERQITELKYPGQSVTFETEFIHKESAEKLFHEILSKISRFERILLVKEDGFSHEIKNHIASPWMISRLEDSITSAENTLQKTALLASVFIDSMPLNTARNLALGLFLQSGVEQEKLPTDAACDFFRRLYSCNSVQGIRELLSVVMVQKTEGSGTQKVSSNISILKTYIREHLDSENLSLKWLAENYLFVSVGYLSKQFIKEEGMRFSDYLNKERMEEAIRLMTFYHNDNVKHIARQVGFGSNPQYFSQVFKRYTGLPPTEYIETLKTNRNHTQKGES
ncbi:response regulator transcription factor [Lacrimispora aerotolerans]|uniref:response regulator transcription factor n=1 Tax=Lacrimispora aerotolerans TaxID=36832 RepID=UPI00047B75F4|nr:response regulator [Lacrimispora aerotolerans]